MKALYIIRGLPGSGKTMLANSIADKIFEADQFRINRSGNYHFDSKTNGDVHQQCTMATRQTMKDGIEKIAVSNTFVKEWEFAHYRKMAREFGYQAFVLIVENRHFGENSHGVPENAIERMRENFEIRLSPEEG
jgi:predicted kinase